QPADRFQGLPGTGGRATGRETPGSRDVCHHRRTRRAVEIRTRTLSARGMAAAACAHQAHGAGSRKVDGANREEAAMRARYKDIAPSKTATMARLCRGHLQANRGRISGFANQTLRKS